MPVEIEVVLEVVCDCVGAVCSDVATGCSELELDFPLSCMIDIQFTDHYEFSIKSSSSFNDHYSKHG